MSGEGVRTAIDGAVATCEINRPESRNALEADLMDALAAALEAVDGEEAVRCIVLAGCDDVFASGGDLRPRSGASGGDPTPEAPAFWRRLGALRKPTVAAVSGWALGSGCELALACDMCVAAERSQFGQPEVTLGIIPGGGAGQRLARVIGKQRAMELVLTGRRFSAEQAFGWGLVNRIAPRASWLQAARDLAGEVAARAPIATRLGKQAVLAAERLSLEEALEAERALHEQVLATEDRVEGVNAFLEGRPPKFEGR